MFFKMPVIAAVIATVSLAACAGNKSTGATATQSTTMTDSSASGQNVKGEPVTYTADGVTMKGYVTYDAGNTGKRPIVLVVPEWWGMTEYPQMRARQLAQLGYLAFAVDMFGDGKVAANPQEAQSLAGAFYGNPQLGKTRFDAALAKAKTYAQADTTQTGAIGYCFGGTMVLNAAKLGSDLDGVVSFHGGLAGPPPVKELLKAKVLVCHGGADSFVPPAQVDAFKKSMDSVGANYQFKVYPNATHAFTNPAATETGKKFNMPIQYNGAADTASWNDMKQFFAGVFQ